MRHIKFRAWDKKENKWVGEMDYSILLNGIIIDKNEADYYSKNLELMQFTGLLDKNGKEVFEGDVVIGNTSYERDSDEYVWTRENPAYVNWIEAQAGFYPFTLGSRWRCDVYNIEVIGNIYENPNLLPN